MRKSRSKKFIDEVVSKALETKRPLDYLKKEYVDRAERSLIESTLRSTKSLREAARRLGVSRVTLWRRCRQLRIQAVSK